MEGVEPVLPQPPVRTQPFVDLDQRFRPEAVDPPLGVLADLDQPRLAQHPKMTRHPRPRDRERICELPGRRRMIAQDLQHRTPALIRQRLQHRIHDAERILSGT